LAQQDSTNLTLNELKQISGLLTEVEYRREQNATFADKENIYKGIIKDYQNGEELYKQEVANLRLNIEAVTPSWYDHFWVASAVTGFVVAGIFLLLTR
jgi:hypothetical protein